MSYSAITYYAIKCDKCDRELKAYYTSKDLVNANAANRGWVVRRNIALCPSCIFATETVKRMEATE